MIKNKSLLILVRNAVALGLAACALSACVGVVAAPGSQWVPGHTGRFGQWIPGHYVGGGPVGSSWDAGHWSKKGNWKPGHWN